MNSFIQIAPNMSILVSAEFGDYNHAIVHDLLRSVDVNFAEAMDIEPYTSKVCRIKYKEGNPKCCSRGDEHEIYLSAQENYWSKWIYQFAHEYCHHLIGGPLVNELRGLLWFEEVICELSSMYHLRLASVQWLCKVSAYNRHFARYHRDYLRDLLSANRDLDRRGFLSLWGQTLSEPVLHRDLYNALASRLLPVFVDSPALWKIILHFGDMRRWESPRALFEHLHSTADDSYRDALIRLDALLFS